MPKITRDEGSGTDCIGSTTVTKAMSWLMAPKRSVTRNATENDEPNPENAEYGRLGEIPKVSKVPVFPISHSYER
jgi:hypothetical protein